MKLCLRQKDNECTMTSLAILLHGPEAMEEDVSRLYAKLGHRKPEVHIQELTDLCIRESVCLVPLDARPAFNLDGKIVELYDEKSSIRRIEFYLKKFQGLCYCQAPGRPAHMLAWIKEGLADPALGRILESYPCFLRTFYAAFKV